MLQSPYHFNSFFFLHTDIKANPVDLMLLQFLFVEEVNKLTPSNLCHVLWKYFVFARLPVGAGVDCNPYA
jgi:hypothetical protein